LSHFIPHTKWKDLLKQNMVVVGFHGSKFTFDNMVSEPKNKILNLATWVHSNNLSLTMVSKQKTPFFLGITYGAIGIIVSLVTVG
jgi:mannitol/fructose-specific phosphotransferase system IIA component (Ntr-type)